MGLNMQDGATKFQPANSVKVSKNGAELRDFAD
jgi:hypothetical protein